MLRIAKTWFTQHWGDLSLRNKGIVCLFLPVAALVLNSALIYRFASERQNAQFWVIHTFKVQLALQHILADLAAVVVDCRTYRLTKDKTVLDEARKGANTTSVGTDALQ